VLERDVVRGPVRLGVGWHDADTASDMPYRVIESRATFLLALHEPEHELALDIEPYPGVTEGRHVRVSYDERVLADVSFSGRRFLRCILPPKQPRISEATLQIYAHSGADAVDAFAARVQRLSVASVHEVVRRFEGAQLLDGWVIQQLERYVWCRWVEPVARIKLNRSLECLELDLEPIESLGPVGITVTDERERVLDRITLRERARVRIEIPSGMNFPATLTLTSDRFENLSLSDARLRSFRAYAIPSPANRWEILRKFAEVPENMTIRRSWRLA
jgi:hypothetical protein